MIFEEYSIDDISSTNFSIRLMIGELISYYFYSRNPRNSMVTIYEGHWKMLWLKSIIYDIIRSSNHFIWL